MRKEKKRIYAIPIYAVLLVPLIVYGRLVDTGLSGFPWFSGHGEALDLFCTIKRILLYLLHV